MRAAEAAVAELKKEQLAAAEKAKAEENIRQHAIRTAQLQAKQRQANQLRKDFGYTGTDQQVIDRHYAELEAEANRERQSHDAQIEANATRYVANVLSLGNAATPIRKYLGDRINLPAIQVRNLIDLFLGFRQNEELRAFVRQCLTNRQAA